MEQIVIGPDYVYYGHLSQQDSGKTNCLCESGYVCEIGDLSRLRQHQIQVYRTQALLSLQSRAAISLASDNRLFEQKPL